MKNILYAEDNLGMRKMVTHYLEALGVNVTAVTDGDEAIEMANTHAFDLLLIDVTMERIDGISATRAIRSMQSINSEIPIIGLTARSENQEILDCREAGMDIVLSKPVDLDLLAKAVLNSKRSPLKRDFKIKPTFPENNLIIDTSVLESYRKHAGSDAVEGILHDFSDLWQRKIGELYVNITIPRLDTLTRNCEELSAIAAGIGAGKVAKLCNELSNAINDKEEILQELVKACFEIQIIVNTLSIQKPANRLVAA